MTARQRDSLSAALAFAYAPGAEFHHGDCVGADAQAAAIARSLGYRIVAHPGFDSNGRSDKRAYFEGNDEVRHSRYYLDRNRDIVYEVNEVYAAPKTMKEQFRGSGTWATVRCARKRGIPLEILEP